ncbi:ABC transporter permease [Natronomonas marina]|jgi:peptide/nickel transport system permease protein|uniref:ABC transporter permease n=1 Tax=Natronomonas marina TaxID=2961939 RepID=UPI0020C9F123|nr:ABC transporter permease [Natronomonas marina]
MSTTNDTDDRPLRERIAENPRPALVWLAGALLLLAAELGRLAGALVKAGDAILFTVGGLSTVPSWVASNVGQTLGVIVGSVAYWIAILLMLFLAGVVVKWLFVPISLVGRLGIDRSAAQEEILERGIIAAVIGVFTALVVLTPFGAVFDAALGALAGLGDAVAQLPSVTSREVIPNQGYRDPNGSGWEGTFLGLSPAWAWALRVFVVYAYAFLVLAWVWKGYNVFRDHYREADWTPRDDTVNRFRGHYWGLFGFAIIFAFVVMALWAPALGPATAQENIYNPYEHEVQYVEDGEVKTTTHGVANINSRSQGGDQNVGPLSYDEYSRWAPLGTNQAGKDMATEVVYGARTSLFVALLAIGLGVIIALVLSLVTAYYKGLVDLLTILTSDTIISIPAFLLVLLLSVLFRKANHPIIDIYDGGLLLGLIFAGVYWPSLWRTIRGPSLQVAEEEWVDAAKSYGQSPFMTMRKHMAPYVGTYLMIYGSLLLGGIIISTAALSFLGLGIGRPTPEWGRIVSGGRSYISTSSWHISTIPGIMIVFVVMGFNALGDGIRDAIDPESDIGEGGEAAATGGGG